MTACDGVDVPTGRECFVDADAPNGHRIGCIRQCPPAEVQERVCASDYGVYPSECHMHKETCEMYGVNTTVQIEDDSFCEGMPRWIVDWSPLNFIFYSFLLGNRAPLQ